MCCEGVQKLEATGCTASTVSKERGMLVLSLLSPFLMKLETPIHGIVPPILGVAAVYLLCAEVDYCVTIVLSKHGIAAVLI